MAHKVKKLRNTFVARERELEAELAREKEVAEMTAKQAKSALQDALARIEVLEKERRLVYFFFIFLVTRVGN